MNKQIKFLLGFYLLLELFVLVSSSKGFSSNSVLLFNLSYWVYALFFIFLMRLGFLSLRTVFQFGLFFFLTGILLLLNKSLMSAEIYFRYGFVSLIISIGYCIIKNEYEE